MRIQTRLAQAGKEYTRSDDHALAKLLLSGIDHPPKETDETLAEYFERGWVFREGDVLVNLDIRPENRWVEIIWWIPIIRHFTVEGMGCLVGALGRVIETYGPQANSWVASGQFDAPGETNEELLERSMKAANTMKLFIPGVEVRKDTESSLARAKSTVGHLSASAKAWIAANDHK